jgi:hypothetical protein
MAAAALQPFGLLLIPASLVVAGLMWSLAPASYWPSRGAAVLAVGILGYGTIVVAALRWPPSPPAIRRIRSTRERVRRLIWGRMRSVRSAARDRLLDQAQLAIRKIDDTINPAFVSLVELNLSLGAQIAELERADPPPSPAVLARSREIYERRRESILGCSQLATDAQAELVELLQEADEEVLLRRLIHWTEALDRIFSAVDAAIVGPDRPRVSEPIPATGDIPALPSPPKELKRLVERALKQLNNARALGEGELATQLSRSVLATLMDKQPDSSGQPTALDKGHALREILVSGIERLRVADKDEAQPPQYHILREEYVLQLENKAIQARHDIPETNFYRSRRDGVEALTAELWQRESRLAAAREPLGTV